MTKSKKLQKYLEEGTKTNKETIEMLEMMTGGPMSLGKAVKAFRQMNELRQEDLAEEVGMVKQTISRIENDQYKPSFEVVVKLSEALKTRPESFLKYLLSDLCAESGYQLVNLDLRMKKTRKKQVS